MKRYIGKVPNKGASVFVVWGLAQRYMEVFWFENVPQTLSFGFLWKLHYIGMIDYIIGHC